ncbi:MAG TPA: phospholipase D-like domain-containing protein [Chitinophagaceae bacterium]|nr:phospholipase D-like domain-containing protein [Chitinophagaceae bacterium]
MKILTGDVWKQINSKLTNHIKIEAAIAYVTSNNLKLKKGDVLICDASKRCIANGETSANILEHYFKKGVVIYSKEKLHAKVLRSKDFVVIGSANLSLNSAESLVEAALFTNDKASISQIAAFIYSIKKKLIPLNSEDISKLKSIAVVRRLPALSKRKENIESFGTNNWILPVHDLKEKIVELEKKYTEPRIKEISQRTGLLQDDIQFIRCTGKRNLVKVGKQGDRLMQIYKNKETKRSVVISFCPIIDITRENGITRFYYDSRDSIEVSWTEFERKTKKLELGRPVKKNSYRSVSDNDVVLLSTVFK